MEETNNEEHSREEEEDRISELPDSILGEILIRLPTLDVSRTSLLSRRWRNICQSVPGIDMDFNGYREDAKYLFYLSLLHINTHLILQTLKLKLTGNTDHPQNQFVVNCSMLPNILHLEITSDSNQDDLEIPSSLYTYCDRLVSLKLCCVTLPRTITVNSISLPNLKVMELEDARFYDDKDQEMLISGCLNLEKLIMKRIYGVNVLKICSKSLMEFSYMNNEEEVEVVMEVVMIDTPKLKYLKVSDEYMEEIVMNNDWVTFSNFNGALYCLKLMAFEDSIKDTQIFSTLLIAISAAKDLSIYSYLDLQRIGMFLESLPEFNNLIALDVKDMKLECWEILLTFLKSCPNLKYLRTKEVKRVEDEKTKTKREEIMKKVSSYIRDQNIDITLTYNDFL